MELNDKCRKCGSKNFIKTGTSKSKVSNKYREKFECRECGHKFYSLKHYFKAPEKFEYVPLTVPEQNWKAYTLAQKNHKKDSQKILKELL